MSAYIVAHNPNEYQAMSQRELYYDQNTNTVFAVKKSTQLPSQPQFIQQNIAQQQPSQAQFIQNISQQQLPQQPQLILQPAQNDHLVKSTPVPMMLAPSMMSMIKPSPPSNFGEHLVVNNNQEPSKQQQPQQQQIVMAPQANQIQYSQSFERALLAKQLINGRSKASSLQSDDSASPNGLKSGSTELLIRHDKKKSDGSIMSSRKPPQPTSSRRHRSGSRQSSSRSESRNANWKLNRTSLPKSYSSLYRQKQQNRSMSRSQDAIDDINDDYYQVPKTTSHYQEPDLMFNNQFDQETSINYRQAPLSNSRRPKTILEAQDETTPRYVSQEKMNTSRQVVYRQEEPVAPSPIASTIKSAEMATPNHVFYEISSEKTSYYEKPIQPIVLQPRFQNPIKYETSPESKTSTTLRTSVDTSRQKPRQPPAEFLRDTNQNVKQKPIEYDLEDLQKLDKIAEGMKNSEKEREANNLPPNKDSKVDDEDVQCYLCCCACFTLKKKK